MAVDRLSAFLDSVLVRLSSNRKQARRDTVVSTRMLSTNVGPIRAYDSGPNDDRPCVIFVPDGPNVIEHYEALITGLSPKLRVVCFDMPGFGYSLPKASYNHSLDQGAQAVLGVMDSLGIEKATLAFSCANGLYAVHTAQKSPHRISQLVLSQTPTLEDMHAWVDRIIPSPIKIPILGQFVAWAVRRKVALRWYPSALPRTTGSKLFQEKTRQVMSCGSCFCLAGVVQGLMSEQMAPVLGIRTPCTIVWGTLDRSHKPTKPDSLVAYVPHATTVLFEDCGHFPEIEQHERYAKLLLRLIFHST
jgi:pimeloyl-ACP methyl ester carboxylesterase